MKKTNFVLTFLFILFCFSASVSAQDLVAWYKFDGNANDASSNTNNGTVTGATLTTDRFGKSNSAYSFNGSSDYISVPHHSSLNQDNITITAWVYANATPTNYNGFIHKRTATDIRSFSTSASTNSLRFSANHSDGTNNEPGIASAVTTGSWQHLAYVFFGGNIKIYVNGALVLNDNAFGGKSLSYSAVPLEIGRVIWFPSSTPTHYYWDGKVDDVKIYDDTLSACQIASQVSEEQNLVAWYKMDGTSSDGSVNTNNGTVTGASLTTDRFGKSNSAYSFNGSSNYITVPHHSTLNASNMTITAWIYANSTPTNYNGFIHKRTSTDKKAFGTAASTNSFRFSANHSDGTNNEPGIASAITTGSWKHVAYVFNGGTISLYVNGVLVLNNATYSGKSLSTNSVALEIGRVMWYPSGTATHYYWNGKVDDLKIYNRAMTACEVQGLNGKGTINYARASAGDEINDDAPLNVVNVYPNPVSKNNLSIEGENIVSVKFLDATGNKIKQVSADFTNIQFDAPRGQYLVQIEHQDGTTTTRKIIKE